MDFSTKYGLGDRIYAIGRPEQGCMCPECMADPLRREMWNILGVSINDLERFDPLTVEGIMILPGGCGRGHSVFYAVAEMPGELLPERHCYTTLREAGEATESMNQRLRKAC